MNISLSLEQERLVRAMVDSGEYDLWAHLPGRLIANRNNKIDGRHARLRPGVVAALSVWWKKLSPDGRNANKFTSQALADMGGAATFYDCLVEVEKVSAVPA